MSDVAEVKEALEVPARPVTEPGLEGLYALPLAVIDARTVAARRWVRMVEGLDYEAAAKALWSVTGEVDGQWPTLWESHTEQMRKQARAIVDAAVGVEKKIE